MTFHLTYQGDPVTFLDQRQGVVLHPRGPADVAENDHDEVEGL
jgi:hypothetical protein